MLHFLTVPAFLIVSSQALYCSYFACLAPQAFAFVLLSSELGCLKSLYQLPTLSDSGDRFAYSVVIKATWPKYILVVNWDLINMKTNLKVDQQSGFVQPEGFPGCVAVSARTGKVPRNLGSSWSPYEWLQMLLPLIFWEPPCSSLRHNLIKLSEVSDTNSTHPQITSPSKAEKTWQGRYQKVCFSFHFICP